MNIGQIGTSAVYQASRQAEGDVVATKVLNKALDVEVAGAAALLKTLPPPVQPVDSSKLPSHIGQNINVVA